MDLGHHPSLPTITDAVYEYCREFAKHPRKGHLMVLAGDVGSGKTHLAKAVYKWASRCGSLILGIRRSEFEMRYHDALFVSWQKVCDDLNQKQFGILDQMFHTPLLIIDDAGAENDPWKIGAEKFVQVLTQREGKFTIVTTNMDFAQWEEKFDRRLASRLFSSVIVDMTQIPDYRTSR